MNFAISNGPVMKDERALPEIIVQRADAVMSDAIARRNGGSLIRLERVPELLFDQEFIGAINKSIAGSAHMDMWFWTGTVGTGLDGHYRINPEGRTMAEKFMPMRDDNSNKFFGHNQTALFVSGQGQVAVSIISLLSFTGRRITVNGTLRGGNEAPVVVVDKEVSKKAFMEACRQR